MLRTRVLAALVVAAVAVACGPGKPPLEQRAGSAVSTSVRTHVHDSVSVGVIDLDRYQGSEPAVFDQVVPNDAVEGVRTLGYVVVTTPGEGIRSTDGFPPADFDTRPLRGFRLTPGRGPIQVVVGFELTHEGVHHVDGFTLRYHVGSRAFEQVFHEAASVCSFGFNAC